MRAEIVNNKLMIFPESFTELYGITEYLKYTSEDTQGDVEVDTMIITGGKDGN